MRFFTKRRNAFWLSLAFALTFACAPMLAQPAPQNGAPPPPQQPQPNPLRAIRSIPPMTPEERDAQRTIPGAYRLTYTLTEMDGTKRIGSQHYVIILDADAPPTRVELHSYVPVDVSLDTGVTFNAHLRQFANGMELSTVIQQTTFTDGANDVQSAATKRPITRRSSFTSTVLLSENKPVTIGQLDTPGSTHSLQIQVELSRVR